MDELEVACRHLLWVYGEREAGVEPGSFTKALISAWEKADLQNAASLAATFPVLGEAIRVLQRGSTDGLVAHLARMTAVKEAGS